MNDPMRLIEADGTEFERLLLSAAAKEVPSSDVSARMLAGAASAGVAVSLLSGLELAGEGALNSSGALASTGSLQVASAGAAAGAAGGSIAPPAVGLLGTWLVKWGIIGVLFSGAVVSGWMVARGPSKPTSVEAKSSLVASPAGRTTAQPGTPPPGSASVASTPSAESPAPSKQEGVATAQVAQPINPARARVSAVAGALGQEVELLDSARRALAMNDAERALSLLASYHRRFPSGALEQEATVLEVDALEARGRAAQATEMKEQFLAEHPSSAHTQRVQRSGSTR